MHVTIFKTNLQEFDPLRWLDESLAAHPEIINWNVDFEDCDNILRIVSSSPVSSEIIHLLTQKGHDCIELD